MSNITTYTHFQTIADTTWTIDHNLGKKVINDVYIDLPGDGIQKVLPAAVEYVDDYTLIIRFSTPRTGRVKIA